MPADIHTPVSDTNPLPAVGLPILVDRLEAARQLSVSPRTLDQLVADDVVPSLKLGGRRLFSPEALRRWVLDQVYDMEQFA